jgi:hypothetical protein
MTKQSSKRHSSPKPTAPMPTYAERTDRVRALGEVVKNCTPLIALTLIWLAYYVGAPSALLTLAMIWARPP